MTDDAQGCDETTSPEQYTSLLLARVAAGDADAMTLLYGELRELVRAVACEVVRERTMAEDVTQEVFVWLWGHADRFDTERGSARAWISVIARRRAIDFVRREMVWRKQSRIDLSEVEDDLFERWERADQLNESLSTLSQAQQAALTATFFEDHSYRQAAAHLELRLSTLTSRVHEGLVSMRRVMNQPAG